MGWMRPISSRIEIADAIVTLPGGKHIVKGERGERCETPGAAAANGEPLGIDRALADHVQRAIDAIVNIDSPPVTVEPFAIGAAEPGAAPVINIQDRESSAGEELGRELQAVMGRGRGPTVASHEEWRELVRRRKVRIGRRIENPCALRPPSVGNSGGLPTET